jgi:acetylornithine deacetylase
LPSPGKDIIKIIEPILEKLVGFDTTSSRPNLPCIDFIRDYLDGFGIASEIVASGKEGKACLWATIGELDTEGGIVLAGHSDVVPVAGQNWTSDPFRLTKRDDRYVARGSTDMKGFIACALAFVPEFLAAKPTSGFHLAFTSDEETDMSGALRLTDHLAAQGVRPGWVWVGEPTGLAVVDQHKGVAAYRTNFTGVPGHSGYPDRGLNAIGLAARFMTHIDAVSASKRAKPYAPSRFDPPYTTFNLGVIKGGSAENIIAENCELLWQMRVHPGETAKVIHDAIVAASCKDFADGFAAFAPQAAMESCTCFDIPPFYPTPDNPGGARLKTLLNCDETSAVSFATEAGIFQKLVPHAVVCGPGHIAQAHQPDEYIEQSQISACVDLMRAVLLSSSPATD